MLLPRSQLPADYQPPPSTGPCDEAARKTVANRQRAITNGAILLGVVIGAFSLFMLLDASFGKSG